MAPQDVARSIKDHLTVINFNAFRMRGVMSQDYVGAGINQIVRKFAVIRADIVLVIGGPVNRNQDVINLRPELTDVFFNEEWIHGNDSRTAVSREYRLAKVTELRVANEPELDTVSRDDVGLSRIREIVS